MRVKLHERRDTQLNYERDMTCFDSEMIFYETEVIFSEMEAVV